MYSKLPSQQPNNNNNGYVIVNGQQVTRDQYNALINRINSYGSSFQSAPSALAAPIVSQLANPIVDTLQPLANVLTYIQSETFWLNTLGILGGLVLVFMALQFIMRYEITNAASTVVKTAVGKGK